MSCNWLVSSISPAQPSTRLRLGVGPLINYTIQFDNTLTICREMAGLGRGAVSVFVICAFYYLHKNTKERAELYLFGQQRTELLTGDQTSCSRVLAELLIVTSH